MISAQQFNQILIQTAKQCSIPACTMSIIQSGEEIFSTSAGECDKATLFDLASVTKLFTASAFMRLVDSGLIQTEDPVCAVLPEFQGMRGIRPFPEPLIDGQVRDVSHGFSEQVDAGKTTFRQLLTHCSGIPAWLPLYLQNSKERIRELVLTTDFSYQPESDVVYSDLGLILVGWAIEKICGCTLDTAIRNLVTEPLGLKTTN